MAAILEQTVNKRRTRVKVNNPLHQPPMQLSGGDTKTIESNEEKTDDNNEEEDVSSDEGTRTYEVSKPTMLPQDLVNGDKEETDKSDDDVFIEDDDEEPPVPAPRLKRVESFHEEEVALKLEEELVPKPLPRTTKGPDEVDLKTTSQKTPRDRKKKRKAAEMISSVLKRESKKLPRVSTIGKDGEDDNLKGKEEENEDVGSPWDSPPAPQELSKVYVQHKHGFSVKNWGDLFKKPEVVVSEKTRCLTKVALSFHDLWSRLMIFSHGIVAGIACCHTLAVAAALASTQYDVPQFVQFYHFLSLKIHFVLYVFTTLCIVSCFDRLDLAQFSGNHLQRMARTPCNLFLTAGYLASMILGLTAHRHTAAIEAYNTNPSLWDLQGLHEWRWIVSFRDVLLVLTWACITLCPSDDLLREKLKHLDNHPSARGFWRLPLPITTK